MRPFILVNERTKSWVYPVLFLCMFLINHALYAQTDTTKSVKINSPKKEEENLNVFQQWIKWNNPGSLAINHLTKQAEDLYDIRDNEIAKLKTRSDWQKRQQLVKDKLKQIIGVFPKKEALNPEITGVIQKDGYRIEKIIFEPVPGYYETGCLYIPDKLKGKAPAILNVFGHDQPAFREEYYQVIITNLVKKGMIVFAIDPLGQGEHVQYYDPKIGFSAIGYTVIEHCYFGNVCFLAGGSAAKHFIWDGMRAIDYLLTRKEVDPENIGVTGFSGGGTVTSYLMAFDERVKVAIPCSWPTTYRRLIETKGVGDAETVLINALPQGITFEDLLEVRSPKPTLMTFTSRDEYLCLQGARDALKEAKKTYAAFGEKDNLQLVEDDSKHAMTPKIRLAMYAFFQKHFNIPGNPAEEKTDLPTVQELTVTPTGQIATSKGGKMIFDLNKIESEKLIGKLEQSRKNIVKHLNEVKIKAKELSGYKTPSKDKDGPFINGRYRRNGYTVELDAIAGESDEYAIPILLFKPDDNLKHPAIVYLHSKGKVTDAEPGGEIEKLVKKGYIVAAADVVGVGEIKHTAGRGHQLGYSAVLIGRSMVGIQAGDIVRVVNYLKGQSDVDTLKIGAIAFNEICLPLIHAAAFDSSINNITLIGSLISYQSVVMNKLYRIGVTKNPGSNDYVHPYEIDFTWGIASVLTAYDLPDLIGSIAPRKIALAELKDAMLKPASTELINNELEFPESAYSFKHSRENLKIVERREDLESMVNWSFK
jgi:dienelactone hydrolase